MLRFGVKKVSSAIEEFGYFDGAFYVLDRLLHRARVGCKIISYRIVVQPTWHKALIPERVYGRYEIREIGETDERILRRMPVSWAVLQTRFDQRARCLGLFHKDALVGYAWLCRAQYAEDELRIVFQLPNERSAFDFDVFIFPDYRGGRAFAVLWEAINRFLKRESTECSYSRISCFNTKSQRSHEKLGAISIGRIIALKCGSRQVILSTLSPYWKIIWRETASMLVTLPGSGVCVQRGQSSVTENGRDA